MLQTERSLEFVDFQFSVFIASHLKVEGVCSWFGKLLPKATPGIIDCITHLMRLDDGLCHCRPSEPFKTPSPPFQLQSTIFSNLKNLRNLKNLLQELEVSEAGQSKSQSAPANATNGRHTLGLICSVLSCNNFFNVLFCLRMCKVLFCFYKLFKWTELFC